MRGKVSGSCRISWRGKTLNVPNVSREKVAEECQVRGPKCVYYPVNFSAMLALVQKFMLLFCLYYRRKYDCW